MFRYAYPSPSFESNDPSPDLFPNEAHSMNTLEGVYPKWEIKFSPARGWVFEGSYTENQPLIALRNV